MRKKGKVKNINKKYLPEIFRESKKCVWIIPNKTKILTNNPDEIPLEKNFSQSPTRTGIKGGKLLEGR
jgi:hypothetical protein